MSEDRLRILKMIEAGQISTDQAMQLLDALNAADLSEEADRLEQAEMVAQPEPPLRADRPQPATWSGKPNVTLGGKSPWWLYPTAGGAVVMAIGAPLMALGLTGRAALFWA